MSDLSPEQRELVEEFRAITNWSGNNAYCVRLLRASGWNLELAIITHYEGFDPSPSVAQAGFGSLVSDMFNSMSQLPNRPRPSTDESLSPLGYNSAAGSATDLSLPGSSAASERLRNSSETPWAARITGKALRALALLFRTIFFVPLVICTKSTASLFYLLGTAFPVLPRLTGIYQSNRHASHSEPRTVNPVDTARRFVREFKDITGGTSMMYDIVRADASDSDSPVAAQPTGIVFFEGGYTEALYRSKKELKWLVVVLQSFEHDDTVAFSCNTLMNPDVIKLLNPKQFIVWGGDVRDAEAFQVAHQLQATMFPFVALVAPKSVVAETQSSAPGLRAEVLAECPSMSVLGRLQGYLSPDRFITRITPLLEKYGPGLLALQYEQHEREVNERLRRQQDEAYQASLQADAARDRQREAQQEAQRAAEEENRKRERSRRLWLLWHGAHLAAEPPAGTPGAVRISFRMPSGERIFRRFAATATLRDMYTFVDCYENGTAGNLGGPPTGEDSTSVRVIEPPENYKHEFKFTLTSPMPRQVLEADENTVVADVPCLNPNGILMVEHVEDE